MDGFKKLVLQGARLAGAGKAYTVERTLALCFDRLREIDASKHSLGNTEDLNKALQISSECPRWIEAIERHVARIEGADGEDAKDSARKAAVADADVISAMAFLSESAWFEPARLLRQARVLKNRLVIPHDGNAAQEWLRLVALHLYQGKELPAEDRKALAVAIHAWVEHGIDSRSALAGDDALINHEIKTLPITQARRVEWIEIQNRARELFAQKHGIHEEAFEMSSEDEHEANELWKAEYLATKKREGRKDPAQATRRYFDNHQDASRASPPPWKPLADD